MDVSFELKCHFQVPWKNISSCLQTNMCTVREYKCGRTFFVVTVIFTFRDRKEEGVMSNRAEQMSDQAEHSKGRQRSEVRQSF